MKKKVIVIGTNHAGTSAINTLLDNYSNDFEITAYDANSNISFLGCGIALWVGGEIENPDGLFYSSPEILKSRGVNVKMLHQIEKIDFKNKTVFVKNLENNNTFEDTYDKLIISVGSWPITPVFNGVSLDKWENVINVKLFQHGEKLIELLKDEKIKKIAIVGGGYIGIELSEACKKYGKEVVVIDNSKEVLEKYYDKEFSSLMSKNLIDHGINLELDQMVIDIKGEGNHAQKLVTNKKEYDIDLAIFSIGINPNTKFLKNTSLVLSSNGAIKVNNQQQTNISDVYAIGDCATIYNNATNDFDAYIGLATNAVRSGKIAAFNIGGRQVTFNGVQGSNAIKIYDLVMCSTGITEEMANRLAMTNIASSFIKDNQKPEFMSDNYEVSLKIVYNSVSRVIIGAQMSANHDISMGLHMFSLAIQEGIKIDQFKFLDLFFLPHFNKPFNYINQVALDSK